ncbi:PadR family transcriptional regulator [Niallia sp. MER 6]|uniref:PadR family transcriptional regulator n=1 Tax=unclassified Niallia TaxID=2837522 RepID=UPI00203F34BB|nr:helix-turn-helix transcriptional regulator [Niallia sp. MER 6]MCM3031774.1 PadR family transcriptional regulator [Niallia sp. MER 6]
MKPLTESTYLVMLALYNDPLHGYGIIKMIERISEGNLIIAPGTLYGILSNLEKQKLIKAWKEELDSRKKKTYTLTEKGKQVFQEEFNRYQKMVSFTERIIEQREK